MICTTNCASVIDYAPEDQTITVGAGMTIGAVADVLAANKQFLAIDAAQPDRMTIGGAIATNRYGRRRLRYGSIKDSIVGIEIVRPDGTRARGGGKVVKNVAGFDIPKLMVGSLGTLGGIISATFRVFPIEQSAQTIVMRDLPYASVLRVCERIVALALVPVSVVAYATHGSYDLAVSFEGFERGVAEQVTALQTIAAEIGSPSMTATPEEERTFDERERAVRTTRAWRLTISVPPSDMAEMLTGGGVGTHEHVVYPLVGAALCATDSFDADMLSMWRERAKRGNVVASAMPLQARHGIDTWGEPPPSIELMRSLKSQFDAKGLCNIGRFIGGI